MMTGTRELVQLNSDQLLETIRQRTRLRRTATILGMWLMLMAIGLGVRPRFALLLGLLGACVYALGTAMTRREVSQRMMATHGQDGIFEEEFWVGDGVVGVRSADTTMERRVESLSGYRTAGNFLYLCDDSGVWIRLATNTMTHDFRQRVMNELTTHGVEEKKPWFQYAIIALCVVFVLLMVLFRVIESPSVSDAICEENPGTTFWSAEDGFVTCE